MKPAFIVTGLCLMAAGGLLSAIGHHDGVLGAIDPESFLVKDRTEEATARLLVLGTPEQAQSQFDVYQAELLMPESLASPLEEGRWVPVHIDGTDAEAYLAVGDHVPAAGTVLVFRGEVQTYWPIYDAGARVVGSRPILLFEPTEYYEPLLFKE